MIADKAPWNALIPSATAQPTEPEENRGLVEEIADPTAELRVAEYYGAMANLRALEPHNPQLSTLTGPNYLPSQAAIDVVNAEFSAARARAAVIQNIDQGGPLPYARDGVAFNNREGLLPARPYGYYQEYTVPVAGMAGRGVQRIIRGQGGEIYYTPDHYNSFQKIR